MSARSPIVELRAHGIPPFLPPVRNYSMNIFSQNGYLAYSFFSDLEKNAQEDKDTADRYFSVIAEGIRFNTLLSVARAGTGHLGASLSMIEILTEIYFRSFSFSPEDANNPDRDIFILSKGHGAPGFYATLAAKGYVPVEKLDDLRRLGGLAGHCDIETPGIEANTGSLAMGLSKAVGYATTKKRMKRKGRVIVIVGDAEIQEGQCWEAFLSAVSFSCDNLTVIIDDNEVQTDQYTQSIVRYGNLTRAIDAMGFEVSEGSGTSVASVHTLLSKQTKQNGKPKLLWCHTRKGQGVSFMEHQNVLTDGAKRYVWHNKAPNKEELEKALGEVWGRIAKTEIKRPSVSVQIPKEPMQTNVSGESVIRGFSEGLVQLAEKEKNLVVLDADLEEDCGFSLFRQKYPERFFEMGIMEQHMVSTASAMSRSGLIPVFGSYAAFLTARSNEQIYNLATENARAIIVGNMAGVLPATPGKSHCGFRDIALMKNIPGITMYQPVTPEDSKQVLVRYVSGELGRLLYLRMSLASSVVKLPSPPKNLSPGEPHVLRRGADAVIISIGPVLLGECMQAADALGEEGIDVEVWNHPWIKEFDSNALQSLSRRNIPLLIIEDHYKNGGPGEGMLAALGRNSLRVPAVKHIAMQEMPTTGFRDETLDSYMFSHRHINAAVKALVGTQTIHA